MTTPLKRYQQHIGRINRGLIDAEGTKVEMKLTFDEWWKIWQDSGKWEQRGSRKGGYVMSRKNDLGHYEVGNVFIQLHADNIRDAVKGKPLSPEHRAKVSQGKKGKPLSPEHRLKMIAAVTGVRKPPFSDEHKAKISASKKGKKSKTSVQIQCHNCPLFVFARGKASHFRKCLPKDHA